MGCKLQALLRLHACHLSLAVSISICCGNHAVWSSGLQGGEIQGHLGRKAQRCKAEHSEQTLSRSCMRIQSSHATSLLLKLVMSVVPVRVRLRSGGPKLEQPSRWDSRRRLLPKAA